MDNPTITIITSGNDPLENLQVLVTIPDTKTIYQGSLKDLKGRIDDYPTQIQKLQDQQAADQRLYDAIVAQTTAAGVADIAAPLTSDLVTAVEAKNDEANAAAIQARIDADKAALAAAANLAEPIA